MGHGGDCRFGSGEIVDVSRVFREDTTDIDDLNQLRFLFLFRQVLEKEIMQVHRRKRNLVLCPASPPPFPRHRPPLDHKFVRVVQANRVHLCNCRSTGGFLHFTLPSSRLSLMHYRSW